MAVARNNVYVSPSVDIKTKAELDSTTIESGLYVCKEEVTIKGVTSSEWTVTCLSTNIKDSLHCCTQIWTSVNLNKTPKLFSRTSSLGETTYSDFVSYASVNSDYPVEFVVGTAEPTPEDGVYKIFIDISG